MAERVSFVTCIRTLISYILFGCLVLIFTLPGLIFIILPTSWCYKSPTLFKILSLFYRLGVRCFLLPITYQGKENLPHYPAIFVANHQSALDIPLLGIVAQGKPHLWLAKKELTEFIFLRIFLPCIAIFVDMENSMKAMRSLLQSINLSRNYQCHLIIFPEGGRFIDGLIHDFYGGFVLIAKKTGMPVIPVCITGVNIAYPPGSFFIHSTPIFVTIGEPFIYTDHEGEEPFKNRVHDWFVTTRKDHV